MRNVFFAALLYVLSLSGQVRAENIVFSDSDLRNEAENLLVEWVDTLLTYQAMRGAESGA